MSTAHYLAIDLGAESGRVMRGAVSDTGIDLVEIHRFPNIGVKIAHSKGETWHWDILRLWHEIQTGIAKATADGVKISGIGIDTWGVDFALLDENGHLLANPVCYRDARTNGFTEKLDAIVGREKLYNITGIQSMFFNTLYQLASLSLNNDPILKHARHLLFMPDLIAYWLTGRMANEYTFASTSMMLDAKTRKWSDELLAAIRVPKTLFPEMIFPGTRQSVWGPVLPSVGNPLGPGIAGIPVIAVGSHDTASAVAGIPAEGEDWLYISSGTWSLMGAEIPEPILSQTACQLNITNEGGVGNTIRLLKNVAGMWLVQECRRAWSKAGQEYDYATLAKLAEAAAGQTTAIIDPDDPSFATSGDMPEKIVAYCQKTNQKVPTTPGQFIRVVLESLAATYAKVKRMIEELTGRRFTRLHIVGGGSQNHLLNQLAANATGLTVIAGPIEATAQGNVLAQAISTGQIPSIAQGRAMISTSGELRVFSPRGK